MKINEARSLLQIVAAVDRRNVTDEMVQAWAGILEDIGIEDAVLATRDWMKNNPDKMIMPGHIAGAVKARRVAVQYGSGYVGRATCRLPGCKCTHDAPCEAGWIEADDGRVFGCPNCRPAVRAVQVTAGSRDAFQRVIRDMTAREQIHIPAQPTPEDDGWDD